MNIIHPRSIVHCPVTLLAAFCLFASGFCFVGCEDHDTVGGKIVDAVSNDDDSAAKNLSGTWTGVSGSSHSQTVVTLNDNNGSLSGSLTWSWGGVRSFSGSRFGNAVEWTTQPDSQGVRDTWRMTLSSNGKKLTGSASKSDGGGYSISLSR